MQIIREIILHCSATPEGRNVRAKDIDRMHRQQGWKCIGYNYVVELDGTVVPGRPLSMIGAHTKGHNSNSIGICYVGGVDAMMRPKDTRTPAQKAALVSLVRELMKWYGLTADKVHCHNEFANKACPSFSIAQFRKELGL